MNFLSHFFYGRNGKDQLNIALMFLAIALNVLSRLLFATFFSALSYVAIALCIFRALSRNLPRRQAENALFLEKTSGFRGGSAPWAGSAADNAGAGGERTRVKKDRANFRYFKCPSCKQAMRVPRGRGKVRITCSNCAVQFYKQV